MTKSSALAMCAALFPLINGCAQPSKSDSAVRVNATVQHFDFEGGFWALRGDDETTYVPLDFPPDFRKDGLRVHAVLGRRDDMASSYMAGPLVDIVTLDLLSCDSSAPCPLPRAPVTVLVYRAQSGLGLAGVFGQNVVRPPGEDAVPAVTCSDAVQNESTCRLQGSRSGRYEADLTAPGMQPGHVAVDVPSRSTLPGECCPVGYVPQFTQVGLNFAN